jgi:hypothetical protein
MDLLRILWGHVPIREGDIVIIIGNIPDAGLGGTVERINPDKRSPLLKVVTVKLVSGHVWTYSLSQLRLFRPEGKEDSST